MESSWSLYMVSWHAASVHVSNQQWGAFTVRFNNLVCRLTDKPDLASVPGPCPPLPGLQEATSLHNPHPPCTLACINTNRQSCLKLIKKLSFRYAARPISWMSGSHNWRVRRLLVLLVCKPPIERGLCAPPPPISCSLYRARWGGGN